MLTNLRVKIIEFFKKHKKEVVILILVAWLILFIYNTILKNQQKQLSTPSTTYTPHVSVMDKESEVPEEYQKPIESIIDTYFNYCNTQEYEKAYNLISEECRAKLYPTLDQFTGYVDQVFQKKKKIYNIQDYSNVDNKYIYNIRILDDILSNGTTDGYYYYEEKFVMIEENGQIKLSIGEYIGDEQPGIKVEDDNMVVEILNKSVEYETETYTVKVTNKTDKYIVISDNYQADEINLDLGEQTRRPTNMTYASFYVEPNGEMTQELVFNKFYDNGLTAQKLKFNMIRVLNSYNEKSGTTEENINSAVKLYGYEINLTK